MTNSVNFVKNEILDYFREQNAEAGNVIHTPAFLHQRMINWNPKQKEALDQAIQELASEGLIQIKNESIALSEAGVNSIYPEVGASVRDSILGFFVQNRADIGHVLHPQAFYHQCMSHWNPKQKQAFDIVVSDLINEGLVEEKNGSIALTRKGVNAIY